MKKILLVLAFLAVFIAGYALGNIVPFSFSLFSAKGIVGDSTLNVKVTMDNGTPLDRIEVDLGEKVGPPPKGGVQVTGEDGVATFKVKPGAYYIFFNTNSFPQNLQVPEEKQVVVGEGFNEATVAVKTKQ